MRPRAAREHGGAVTGVSQFFVRHALKLTLLPPRIVETIVAGREVEAVSVEEILGRVFR